MVPGACEGNGMSCDHRPILVLSQSTLASTSSASDDGFKGRLRSVFFLTHCGSSLLENQVSELSCWPQVVSQSQTFAFCVRVWLRETRPINIGL